MARRNGPVTRIKAALQRATGARGKLATGNLYDRWLASEGYVGGYAQALSDVLLVLNGVRPSTRDYWRDFNAEEPGHG